jgi:hypothetical protein
MRIPAAGDAYEAHLMIMGIATGQVVYDVRLHPDTLDTPVEKSEIRYISIEYGIPEYRIKRAIQRWAQAGGREQMRFPHGTPA